MLAYSTNPHLRKKTKYGRIFEKQRKDELRKQRERDNSAKVIDIAAKVSIRPKMQKTIQAYYGQEWQPSDDRDFRNLIYDEVWQYLNLSKDNRWAKLEALFNAVVKYLYEAYQLDD